MRYLNLPLYCANTAHTQALPFGQRSAEEQHRGRVRGLISTYSHSHRLISHRRRRVMGLTWWPVVVRSIYQAYRMTAKRSRDY